MRSETSAPRVPEIVSVAVTEEHPSFAVTIFRGTRHTSRYLISCLGQHLAQLSITDIHGLAEELGRTGQITVDLGTDCNTVRACIRGLSAKGLRVSVSSHR